MHALRICLSPAGAGLRPMCYLYPALAAYGLYPASGEIHFYGGWNISGTT